MKIQPLDIGSVVLAAFGLLGFVGLIGPTAESSIFGSAWWFDNAENWAHLVLDVVGLAAAYVLPTMYQKWLVVALGVLGALVGLYSLVGAVFGLQKEKRPPMGSLRHF